MRKTLISLIAIAVAVPLVAVFAQKNPPVSKTFTVGAESKIVLADDKAGALADLKVGDKIGIAYHEDGTTFVADRIHVASEDKAADKGAGKGTKAHDGKLKDDLRARGVITAVDTKVGTVTVDVHEHHKKAPEPKS